MNTIEMFQYRVHKKWQNNHSELEEYEVLFQQL